MLNIILNKIICILIHSKNGVKRNRLYKYTRQKE